MGAVIDLCITVDWEGLSLDWQNLRALADFRRNHPAVPLTHMLNPAYHTEADGPGDESAAEKVGAILQSGDELGLHLHPIQSFVEAAGVEFKTYPSFSRDPARRGTPGAGHEVMLHAYSPDELDRLLAFGLGVLEEQGFGPIKSFRAGGWMADTDVFEALYRRGLTVDSSAVVPSALDGTCWEGDNLQRYLRLMWGDHHRHSQPYWMSTPDGAVFEIPNNLGAVDYWSPGQAAAVAGGAVAHAWQKGHSTAVVVAHQETASQYTGQVEALVAEVERQAANAGVEINYTTLFGVYGSAAAAQESAPTSPSWDEEAQQ